jgi:HAE1 family hydrophobic/amphiphilic exporter-1
VDPVRAADLGLTRAEVADTVQTYVLGRVATRYREGGDEFDVRVQLREADRRSVDQLAELPILTPRGGTVPLKSVATFAARTSPTAIARLDQERIISVVGGLGDRPLDAVIVDLQARLDLIKPPRGFTITLAGEQVEQQETFSNLLVGILLALFLVYMVMAVQFESIRHPLVIMVALPFAFIGVILALILTDTTFNMNSFLGAIVLVGIVVNNAIVLVDTINLLRRERHIALLDAIQEAARRRLRPILMTTLTTVLAMVPLASGLGEGSEIQAPMARVIVGGLLSSTIVTLVIVPCVYYLMERRRARASA